MFWVDHGSLFPWDLKHVHIYSSRVRMLWPARLHTSFFGPWRSKEKWCEGRKGPCAQRIFPETLGICNYSLFAGRRRHSNLYTWYPLLPCRIPFQPVSLDVHILEGLLLPQICFFPFLSPHLLSSFPPFLHSLLKKKAELSKG